MILDEILTTKREELARGRSAASAADLRGRELWGQPRRGFHEALLRHGPGRRIVAEIKKASPSKGVIRADFDPARHAADYQTAGARCLSVLTDERYFQGCLENLAIARRASSLPVLRKDFTIDAWQITEARAAGADAVLLIVAALERSRLADLLDAALAEGLDALVEVHDEAEMTTALELGCRLIGINNRNLHTFETSLEVSRRLAPMAPPGVTVVAESGLARPEDLADLEAWGAHAFLIGEAFMRAADPGQELARFRGC
jgi:indole-3-glycerol phosphate synthase